MKNFNFKKTMDNLNLVNSYENVTVNVELITPLLAKSYLTKNFEHNRNVKSEHLKALTLEMKMNRFYLSNDAITFEQNGKLTNGQHRLNAVVESDTSQPFLVARNMVSTSKSIIDVGKRRNMADRIQVGGIEISLRECSSVRHAMATNILSSLGTNQYARTYHDNIVAHQYKKHTQFFDEIKKHNFSNTKAFWIGAALKIYAEMLYNNKQYAHGMSPLNRSLHFIYILHLGASDIAPVTKEYDFAATCLKNKALTRKSDEGKYWDDPHSWACTITAAYNFMIGKGTSKIHSAKKDPFSDFKSLPSTNRYVYK